MSTATYTRIFRSHTGRLHQAPACRRCKHELRPGQADLHPACRTCAGCLAEPDEPCDPFCLSQVS